MATRLLALLILTATSSCVASGTRARDPNDDDTARRPNVDSARELDQQGVRNFREGRYADAIRYFRQAYRMGGPPSELWNIARSRERLDDAEGAASAFDEYLAQGGIRATERADAERERQALSARPSLLTVTTTPAGAIVTIDGKQTAGPTPLTLEIRAGSHTLAIHREGYAPESRPLEARFGHAVIVSLDLQRDAK